MLLACLLLPFASFSAVDGQGSGLWWNANWASCRVLNLTETLGRERISEPTDIFTTFPPNTCTDPKREVRVVFYDGSNWTEVSSQVYNITKKDSYVESCNVVFLAACPPNSTVTYYLYYNNPLAATPVYDGLRLYEQLAGDSYNITAVSGDVEKNYTHVFWKGCMDLYVNGDMATWPGGQAGWEFSQIVLGSLWADASDTPWFGAGKLLSVMESGPLFVDMNYTEAYASDLWGGVYDHNITTTLILRILYRPSLQPLVYFQKTFKVVTDVANYTLRKPIFLDFKLADSSSRAIYQDFTWKGLNGSVQVKKTEVPVSEDLWSPNQPVGWWSYNGSRTDTTDRPKADVGMIPVSATGTVNGVYTIQVVQSIENDDHHCSQWMSGDYNMGPGDMVEITGYVTTNVPVDESIDTVMENEAQQLRNPEPLQVSLGQAQTIQLVDRQPPTLKEVIPSLAGQEILEGQQVEVESTVVDEVSLFAEKPVQPSGVLNVSLQYSVDAGATWKTVDMTKNAGENTYSGSIPSFESGTKVSYKVVAVDNLLNVIESSVFSYKVVAAPQVGVWFALGFGVGAIVAIVLAAAAYYARKKG
jgi:hypothetical protein